MDINNIYKIQDTHQTVTYVALVPDMEDLNGDIINADEIIKTAHEFIINLQEKNINVDHKKGTDIDKEDAIIVESYILPVEIKTPAGKKIPAGSWLLAIKFSDDLRDDVKAGKFVGISIEGKGKAKEIA